MTRIRKVQPLAFLPKRFRALVLLLLSLLLLAPQPAGAVPQPPEPALARVYFSDKTDLDQLAGRLDVWEVYHAEGYLVALLRPADQAKLAQEGYRVVVDRSLAALLALPPDVRQPDGGIPGFSCYRTVEETEASLAALAARHPHLARLVDFGDSWEKVTPGGLPGYNLWSLVLTNRAIPGPKPAFVLMAAIHAREYTTAETAARFAEYLLGRYGVDPDVTWLLDTTEVHVLPVANPDGRKLAETGLWWRKNTDSDDGCPYTNAWGTDLNRNSSFRWGGVGSSPDPCTDTYRGPAPASEPETQAIQAYLANLFPDRRGPGDADAAPLDTPGLFISLHSYSELVLWPWGWTPAPAPNAAQLQTLGRKLAAFNGYLPQQSDSLYATTGATDDWAYGELGVASYTFEMGTAFFESCTDFESRVYPDNLQALLYAARATPRPYALPAGPDPLNVVITPTQVTAGAPVTVTATLDDGRYPVGIGEAVQAVAAGRVRLTTSSSISSTLPAALAPGEPVPMAAADGTFNTDSEAATASLDTTGLPPGRYLVTVEGQDAAGNWGVPGAAFLWVEPPGALRTYFPFIGHTHP